MVQIRASCRDDGQGAPRSLALLWLGLVLTAALLACTATAVKSGGLDRLLPKNQAFAPYFTT
jgi:hypothetical protein